MLAAASLPFAGAALLPRARGAALGFTERCRTGRTCKVSFPESPLVSHHSALHLPAFHLSADFSHCILSPPLCILPLHTGVLFMMSLSQLINFLCSHTSFPEVLHMS